MNWKTIYLLTLIFGYGNLNACSTIPAPNSGTSNRTKVDTLYKKANFDSTILVLDERSKDSETWDVFFDFKEFKDIHEHSPIYLKDAMKFLSNESYSERQKKLCLCSMQRAPLEGYVKIVVQCKELYDNDKISEGPLDWAIVPNFSKAHTIARNYNDDNVRDVLNNILQDKKISTDLKETVKDILSGVLWKNIREIEGN